MGESPAPFPAHFASPSHTTDKAHARHTTSPINTSNSFFPPRPTPYPPPSSSARCAGWEQAALGWREIPRGMSVRKIWFDLSFAPLIGVVGVASFLMGGIIMKHFSGHTDVAIDKKVRMDHNHQVRSHGHEAHRLLAN